MSGLSVRRDVERPWFPRGYAPLADDPETQAEREKREDAERELYAELDAREYNEVTTREAEAEREADLEPVSE